MEVSKKKNSLRKMFFLFFTFAILFIWGSYLYLSNDTAFSPHKIRPARGFAFQKTNPYSQEELEHLKVITSQNFRYLAQGTDAYVFVSEDDKYVVKFFNMRRITPKYWLNYVPVPWLDKKRVSKVSEREKARQEIFSSLKIAYEHFRYQTNFVFLHLFHTDFLKIKLKVIDKVGKEHKVSLDRVPFVVQKKAIMLNEYIGSLLSQGKEDEAIHALCRILTLVKDRCQKGFTETDEAVEIDYGFIEGRPVHVGVSRLLEDESLKSARSTLQEVFVMGKALEAFLQQRYPSLVEKFQDEVQDLLSFLEDSV